MLIEKSDLPLVDMEFMNDVHFEDVDIINEIFELILAYGKEVSDTTKTQLNQKYHEWISHTQDHFKGEEVLMVEKGFPPYTMHKSEHDRALAQMEQVFNEWQSSGDISVLKIYFIEYLPQWLVHHINTMDTVTARFLKTGMSPCSSC